MFPFNKPIQDIDERDIHALIGNAGEDISLDYKLQLPSSGREDRKEFLCDVTAMANTAGGYLLYGIDEENGLATRADGIAMENPDAEKLRLEGWLYGVKPRIPGLHIKPLRLENGRFIVIIEVPRSWAKPHMVTMKDTTPFHARHSAGNYAMDVDEIRAAFLTQESSAERFRAFRADRIAAIRVGEAPVKLSEGPKQVLHIVPLQAFGVGRAPVDVVRVSQGETWKEMAPRYSVGRFNLDGVLAAETDGATKCTSYVQLYRSGILEIVSAQIGYEVKDRRELWPMPVLSARISATVANALRILRDETIPPPMTIALTLIDASGYCAPVRDGPFPSQLSQPVDRDVLLLPETLLDELCVDRLDCEARLEPLFDVFANALGRAKWPR